MVRNRLRRRIREAFGRLRPYLAQGADIIIVPRPSASNASFGRLASAISAALEEAGVLKDSAAVADIIVK